MEAGAAGAAAIGSFREPSRASRAAARSCSANTSALTTSSKRCEPVSATTSSTSPLIRVLVTVASVTAASGTGTGGLPSLRKSSRWVVRTSTPLRKWSGWRPAVEAIGFSSGATFASTVRRAAARWSLLLLPATSKAVSMRSLQSMDRG
ncbi:hypothetical protein ADK60_25840 [Streptomyces sp. XY431]|nr:hypothetical protein ADK60_25840 [Streptomyces sp. XY431]